MHANKNAEGEEASRAWKWEFPLQVTRHPLHRLRCLPIRVDSWKFVVVNFCWDSTQVWIFHSRTRCIRSWERLSRFTARRDTDSWSRCIKNAWKSSHAPDQSPSNPKGNWLFYHGHRLQQTYIPDLVCFDQILVELKAVKELADEHRAQLLNYLKASRMKVG
jgi:hypothetical protein